VNSDGPPLKKAKDEENRIAGRTGAGKPMVSKEKSRAEVRSKTNSRTDGRTRGPAF
jgi:hypothetical protein